MTLQPEKSGGQGLMPGTVEPHFSMMTVGHGPEQCLAISVILVAINHNLTFTLQGEVKGNVLVNAEPQMAIKLGAPFRQSRQ